VHDRACLVEQDGPGVQAMGELADQRGETLARDGGAGQRLLSLVDPLDRGVLLRGERMGDGLADRDERDFEGDLEQRQPDFARRVHQSIGCVVVRQPDAEPQPGHACVGEPLHVDVRLQADPVEELPGREQQLATLEEPGGIGELAGVHPGDRPVEGVLAGPHRQFQLTERDEVLEGGWQRSPVQSVGF
jgi:hypothetical protein